jgi:acyl-CoA synthetase (NDP forming)
MNIHALFQPRTLAVIGVSRSNDLHPANVIYSKNLLRYPVEVYAVNPRGGRMHGERVYSSLAEISRKVDLAVIAVRADLVPGVLAECIREKVGGAVVISGGFAEIGRQDLQDTLADLASRAAFPLIGPNCLGIFSPARVDTFFLPSERMISPQPGNVAIISQSGGILVDLLVKFHEEGIGLSAAVSIGNKAFLREEHLLEYFAGDRQTGVIGLYIEGFGPGEGRRFVDAARGCPKPVVVMKAGKTEDGGRAVSSHTASLAGDHRVFSGVLAQAGVREAKNQLELLSFCESLSYYPEEKVNRAGIVTSSGGHGAMAVDACLAGGLVVPPFSSREQESLRRSMSEAIRPIAATGNPVDLTGSAQENDFFAVTSAMADFSGIDCIIMLLLPYLPGISSDLGARLSLIRKKTGKPLIAYVPHVEKYRMLFEGLEMNHVPASSSIEGAVLMARALRRRP